jgi:hypothetical protein
VGSGGTPTVTPLNVGNPDLKPEVTRELEAGFDASLFNNRVTLEATYYNKVTEDGIFSALSSPSSGFPGNRFINIGQFSNRGIELSLSGAVIDRKELQLNLRTTLSTNRNRIDRLGQDAAIPNTGIGQLVGAFNAEGFPMGSFFYKKVVSATLVKPGQVTDVRCAGGTNFGRPDGTTVSCDEAPLVYSGSPIPTWLGALSGDISWRSFRLAAVTEFQGGHYISDGNVGGQHIFFNDSRAAVEQTDPILVALQQRFEFGQAGLMKAGFGKVRNVSLTYQLPTRWAGVMGASRGSVTLTGTNLGTIYRAQSGTFGTQSIDTEVRPNSPNYANDPNLTNGYTQESWPQFRRFLATIRLSF